MANFLKLCNDVSKIVGLQGSILSVETPIGLQVNIVDAVRDSWIDIQTYREDWAFLIGSHTSFSTVADQTEYTPIEVFGSLSESEDLSTYKKERGIFLEYKPLSYLPYEYVPFVDNSIANKPTWYSINEINNNLIFDKPDDTYNLVIRYHRTIQELEEDTDVPTIPSTYHNVIKYKAIEKVAAHIGNGVILQKYERMGNIALAQLMRKFIHKKEVNLQGFA